MISLARAADPSKSIVFFDRELENQTVVYALLDAIYEYELPPLYQTSTILYLIDLADKWGVQVVLKIVRKNLEAAFWLSSTRNFDLFLSQSSSRNTAWPQISLAEQNHHLEYPTAFLRSRSTIGELLNPDTTTRCIQDFTISIRAAMKTSSNSLLKSLGHCKDQH